MKRFAPLCLLLLVGSLPGFAATKQKDWSSRNQFHFSQAGARAMANRSVPTQPSGHKGMVQAQTTNSTFTPINSRMGGVRALTANPPTGKIGFVSATQVPAGGALSGIAMSGDFNGDGKMDLASIVQTENTAVNPPTPVYSVAVVLSNGDGTFATPKLTPIVSNDPCPGVVVGDVDGDKKDDIIIAHIPSSSGSCSNGYKASTLDVLISNGDGTFTQKGSSIPVTTNSLVGGTLADANADGKLDIVAVDQNNPANVWTLLGNGDGTFNAATSAPLGGQIGTNLIIADLNGDGLLDIADNAPSGGSFAQGQPVVYLATSQTAYASPVALTNSDGNYSTCGMNIGDLNGDGKPELITSNCWDDTITIYVNNGSGTFQQGVYYQSALDAPSGTAADVTPFEVTVADVNGDGKADVISTNQLGGDITILIGKGDGTVNVPTVGYAVGGWPTLPAIVADFNGDGLPDIAVADGQYSFAYLKGYGDGTFRSALDYYAPLTSTSGTLNATWGFAIATGDFNGDGHPDFVIGNTCSFLQPCTNASAVTVFLSRSDGTLQPGVNYQGSEANPAKPPQLQFVAVGDFNKDGILDIAATDSANGVVQIFLGNGTNGVGDGTFTAKSTFATDATNSTPYQLAVGDFNGDGYPDIAVINNGDANVGVLINDKTGNFLAPVTYALSKTGNYEITAADVNNDQKLDLLVPLFNGNQVAVLIGNGDGTFQTPEVDTPAFTTATNAFPISVTVADINGDGNPDLLVPLDQNVAYPSTNQGIGIALGNGKGTFQTPTLLPSTLQNDFWNTPQAGLYNYQPAPSYVHAVDVDGDGILDLVYTNSNFGTIGVLFGEGGGNFYDPVEFPAGGYAYGLVMADVNGDGSPDVVAASDNFGGVTVMLNNNGSATKPNFALSVAQNSATVKAGSNATYDLTVAPSNFFSAAISFACSGLPSKATCTFSPTTVTPNGNAQLAVQLTISTTATTTTIASLRRPASVNSRPGSAPLLATFGSLGLFGVVLAGGLSKKRNRWMGIVLGVLILAMMFSLVGCGGNSTTTGTGGGTTTIPGTPAGTYTVKVTGTGSTTTQTVNLTLVVQ